MSRVRSIVCDHPGGGEMITKQAFKDECDVNAIVERYRNTGVLSAFNQTPGRYGDFTGVGDFHSAMNRVRAAEEMFLALPAEVRDACGNDPGRLLDMVNDPARTDELVALGLVERGKVELPPEPVPPPPPVPKVVVPEKS